MKTIFSILLLIASLSSSNVLASSTLREHVIGTDLVSAVTFRHPVRFEDGERVALFDLNVATGARYSEDAVLGFAQSHLPGLVYQVSPFALSLVLESTSDEERSWILKTLFPQCAVTLRAGARAVTIERGSELTVVSADSGRHRSVEISDNMGYVLFVADPANPWGVESILCRGIDGIETFEEFNRSNYGYFLRAH